MADLQLIGLDEDGEHVLLRASDGSRFKLAIDEQLRAAVRRDRPQLEHLRATARGTLPPREIQARVRAGLTAEQIAEAAGITLEQVRRYEGPVLAEREFMVSQAQRTRVGKDQGAPDLGDLVTDRLAARKIDTSDLIWDSFRPASGPWTIQVDYAGEQGPERAAWAFDPQARSLTALDDKSRWLSETAIPDEPVPRRHLSPVRSRVFDIEAEPLEPSTPATTASVPSTVSAAEVDETSRILQDLRTKRGVRQVVDEAEVDVQDSQEEQDQFEGFGPQQTFTFTPELDPATEQTRQKPPSRTSSDTDDGSIGKLFSLADGAGRKRASASTAASAPEPVEPNAHAGDSSEPSAPEQADDVPPPLERVKPGRKGRPKVPSWDEIVFGAKPE